MKKAVLFVDDHNSLESQIAELYLNQFYGDSYEAYSAGLSPTQINPYLHEAMIEEGIDVSVIISAQDSCSSLCNLLNKSSILLIRELTSSF